MKLQLRLIVLSSFLILLGCNESSEDDVFMPPDCVNVALIFQTPEDFQDCPTEATANLCSNLACDISIDEDSLNFIEAGECEMNDCFTMTCTIRESIIGAPVIGDAVLTIDQLRGPQDSDLFIRVASFIGSDVER